MPKISVVLTCYNSNKEYLDECVNSLLNQTYKDFELIVVDDCSKPYLKNLIDGYIKKDNRIKYFRTKQNGGPAEARNLGIDKSVAEYIAIVDHDDIVDLKRFEKQVAFLDENPEVGILGGAFKRFPNVKEFYPLQKSKEIELSLLLNQNEFCQASIMMRKSLLDRCKIRYRKEYNVVEDYDFFIRFIGKTKFYNLSDVLIYYRIHDSNISKSDVNKVILLSAELRVNYLMEFLKINNDELKKALVQLDLQNVQLSVLEKHLSVLIHKITQYGYDKNKVLYYLRKKYIYASRKSKKPFFVLRMYLSPLSKELGISFGKRMLFAVKHMLKSFLN